MYLHRLVVVAALVLVGLVVPTPASAAVTPLTVSPTQPLRDQAFTIKGKVTPTIARTVRLQRYLGGRWTTARTTRTRSSGRYSFSFTSGASSLTLRTYVPKVKVRGRTYASQKSAKRVVRLAPTSTFLSVAARSGHRVEATVTSAVGARPRTVRVQHLAGDQWADVAKGTESASGRTVLDFDAPDPGTRRYRAVVSGSGVATSQSAQVPLTVESPVARIDIRADGGTPITSGETYVPGTIAIDPRGSGLAASTSRARLRVRGNSTSWVMVKLSYKVKLDTKTSILGMPASKDWVLLANFFDRSLVRNEVALEAGRIVRRSWTPRMHFAEVWVDGSYRGLFQVGEGIEVEKDRVVMPEGAHLLEGDSHDDTDPAFRTRRGFQIFFKEPDDPDTAERAMVAEQVQAVEDSLYAQDLSRIDVDSFVDWYIVNELLKNVDSVINNSDWMILSPAGTLAMGPVWDFDQAMGNRTTFDADLPTGLYTGHLFATQAPSQIRLPEGHWFNQLLATPEFVERLKARWAEVRGPLAGLSGHVTSLARQVRDSAPRNFEKGNGGMGLPVKESLLDSGPGFVFHGSWPAEIAALRTWIAARYAWLDDHLTD